MTQQQRNLTWVLSGRDKSASKTMSAVGKKADGLSAKLGGIGKSMAFGVAGGAAAAGTAIGGMLAVGIKGASDLAESQSKVNTVFGASAKEIRTFSNSAARDLGMTRQAALEAAGTFGNLFSALGIGVKPAADMSKKLVTLATDLGSFNNVSSDEALLALRSGLLGEAEPLRKFGVSLSAARIEAEAFSLGLVKPVKDRAKITAAHNAIEAASLKVAEATKKHGKNSLQARQALDAQVRAETALEKALKGSKVELTAAQKAQAAYSVILKDTKVAQGDFARTSGGLANQTKILKAQLSDTATSIGQQLLPYLTQAATFVNDKVVPAFQRFVDQFKRGVGPGGEFRQNLADLGGAAKDAWPHIKEVGDKTATVVNFVIKHKDAFTPIAAGVAAYATAMKAAALWSAAMGVNGPKAAAGIGAVGAATGAAGAAGTGSKFARSAGIGGAIGVAILEADKLLPKPLRMDDNATLPLAPKRRPTPTVIPPAPRTPGSSQDRSSTLNTPTKTFPRKGQTANLAVNFDGRSMTSAVSETQQQRYARGFLPAY